MGRRIYKSGVDTVSIGTAVQDVWSMLAGASNGIQLHWLNCTAAGVTTAAELRLLGCTAPTRATFYRGQP
jgi:hypothetical protein